MEHISDRAVRSTEGLAGSTESAESWAETPSVHITGRETAARVPAPGPVPVPERIGDELRGPDGELIFDDSRTADRARRPGFKPIAPEFRSERARKQAFHAMEHRQWHWRAPTVVVVVLVVFGVLAFVGSRRSNNHSTTQTSITTVAGHQTSPSHQGSTVPTTKPPRATTTTTTKPPAQLIATSTSAGAATYSVGTSNYNIVITASGLCWVDAVDASSGNAIFTGTVQPGASQVIHATGATNVTMGASFTSMTANNIPVVLPTPFQVPFTATFQPPASTASTTTSTTTTTPGSS
jgi:hypothetical protein